MVAAHASHSSSSGEWIACLDKRPLERSSEDVDIIFTRLKEVKAFEKFHPNLLQQICLCGYYENLEKGITLFRQGDIGTNWYAVLTGSLDVKVSDTSNHQDAVTICTLGIGTAFGESILDNTPRHATIVTREHSELLRIEQKDFKALWELFMPQILKNITQDVLPLKAVVEISGSAEYVDSYHQSGVVLKAWFLYPLSHA